MNVPSASRPWSARVAALLMPALLLSVLLLSACGFRLAGGGQLSPEMSPLQLDTRGFDADQLRDLQRRLRQAGAQLVEQSTAATHRLQLRLESPPDTRLVSGAGSRSVQRVERRLAFRLWRPGGDASDEKVLVQRRELSADDDDLPSTDEQRDAAVAELEQALYNLLINQLVRL